jgi:hypothetical protein
MRLLLAALLAMALSVSPVVVYAAAMDCDQPVAGMGEKSAANTAGDDASTADMGGMDMSGMVMPNAGSQKAAPAKNTSEMPCCHHGMKDCAKLCGAMHVALLPTSYVAPIASATRVTNPTLEAGGSSYEPPRTYPPPRTTGIALAA